jgi:hypothetical protein
MAHRTIAVYPRRVSILLTLALAAGLAPLAAVADVQTLVVQGTISATGPTQPVLLSGQNSCAVTLSGSGTGITLVPQATSDTQTNIVNGTAVWSTASAINGGAISYNGVQTNYVGSVASTGITGFRINVTSYSSGSASYTLTCSPSLGMMTVSTMGTQTVQGSGTAGAPTGGVVSVQGVPGGVAQSVSCVSAATCPVAAAQSGAWSVAQSGMWNVATTGQIATFSIAPNAFAVGTGGSDVFQLQGSATKIIRVRRIILVGTAGAGSSVTVTLTRRSTADTGGTAVTPAIASMDTNNASATAVATTFNTMSPTQGTVTYPIQRQLVYFPATGFQADVMRWEYGTANEQPITLRGTSDYVGLFVNAPSTIVLTVIWTEE